MLVFEVGHIYFFFKQNEIDGLEKVAVGSNQNVFNTCILWMIMVISKQKSLSGLYASVSKLKFKLI